MGIIEKFKPSIPPFSEKAGQAKERPKPAAPSERTSLNETEREKPTNIVSSEEFEKRRQKITSPKPKTEEEPAKSAAQIKGEIQQRFMDKIKEIKKQFEKLDEGNK